SASTVAAAPGPVNELNMITGSRGYSLRISTSVSIPLMPGISTSSVIRSGLSSGMRASAMLPLPAMPATAIPGSAPSTSESWRRMTAESSTINTRIGCTVKVLLRHSSSPGGNPWATSQPPDGSRVPRRGRAGCRPGCCRLAAVFHLEPADQFAQLAGHVRQLLGGDLCLAHVVARVPRRRRHSIDVACDRARSPGSFGNIARHLSGGRALLFNSRRDRRGDVADLVDHVANPANGTDRARCVLLDDTNLAFDLLGRLGGLLG